MIEYTHCADNTAATDKLDATVVHQQCYSRPLTGFYFVEELLDVIDEAVIHWDSLTKLIVDDDGQVLATVEVAEPLTILTLVKVTPNLKLVRHNEAIGYIERSMGREVAISLPGYDLADALVLKRLGKAKRKISGWQLLTRIRDPNHWVRMINPVFGTSDRGVVTVEGVEMAKISGNMLIIDDSLSDERQRATVLALAINTWVK